MALSKPRFLYGIHQATIYHILTGKPYGTLRVLKGSTISVAGELVQLTGGSSKYSWDAQDGAITAEMLLKPAELPSWLFKVLLGKTPTDVLDDPGNTSALTNILNTSVQDAAIGIASVGVKSGSENDLKFGTYIVEAVSATTIDVYGLSNVDFQRGADVVYVDDTLKINSTPLTITGTAGVTDLPDFGVEFTGGSGVVAMEIGDTAKFDINPPSLEQMDVKIGGLNDCIPEFGAIVVAQKQADGSMYEFDCLRVKAQGIPFGMEEKAYNEAEITATLLYDSEEDAVLKARYLKPQIACS